MRNWNTLIGTIKLFIPEKHELHERLKLLEITLQYHAPDSNRRWEDTGRILQPYMVGDDPWQIIIRKIWMNKPITVTGVEL